MFLMNRLRENHAEKDFDYYVNIFYYLKSIEEFENSLSMYDKAKKLIQTHHCVILYLQKYI